MKPAARFNVATANKSAAALPHTSSAMYVHSDLLPKCIPWLMFSLDFSGGRL